MGLNAAETGVFRQEYPLHYPDADAAGYLRLTSLMNLLQIQAGEHTASRGFDYRQHQAEGVFWVLSRMTLRLDSWPVWPGALIIDTWARSTRAVLALRDFRFGTQEGWSGRASSAWVLLKDRKPQRPEPWVAIYDQVRPEEPAAELPVSLPPFDVASEAQHLAEPLVRHTHGVHADWEDIDMNGHVNNVNAIGWCLSLHDYDFLMKWRPQVVEVNFLAEMFCGQKFVVVREDRPAAEGRMLFDYLVLREPDQIATARVRIAYREAQKSG